MEELTPKFPNLIQNNSTGRPVVSRPIKKSESRTNLESELTSGNSKGNEQSTKECPSDDKQHQKEANDLPLVKAAQNDFSSNADAYVLTYNTAYASNEGRIKSAEENGIIYAGVRTPPFGNTSIIKVKRNNTYVHEELSKRLKALFIAIKQCPPQNINLVLLVMNNRIYIATENDLLNRKKVLSIVDLLGIDLNLNYARSKIEDALVEHFKQRIPSITPDIIPEKEGLSLMPSGVWVYEWDKHKTWTYLFQHCNQLITDSSETEVVLNPPEITDPDLERLVYFLWTYAAFVNVFHHFGITLNKAVILVGDRSCMVRLSQIFNFNSSTPNFIFLAETKKAFQAKVDSEAHRQVIFLQVSTSYSTERIERSNVLYALSKANSGNFTKNGSDFLPIFFSETFSPLPGQDVSDCLYIPISRKAFEPKSYYRDDVDFLITKDSHKTMMERFIRRQDEIQGEIRRVLNSAYRDVEEVFRESVSRLAAFLIAEDGYGPRTDRLERKLCYAFEMYLGNSQFNEPDDILRFQLRNAIESGNYKICNSKKIPDTKTFNLVDVFYHEINKEVYYCFRTTAMDKAAAELFEKYPKSRLLKSLRDKKFLKANGNDNFFSTTITCQDGDSKHIAVYAIKETAIDNFTSSPENEDD